MELDTNALQCSMFHLIPLQLLYQTKSLLLIVVVVVVVVGAVIVGVVVVGGGCDECEVEVADSEVIIGILLVISCFVSLLIVVVSFGFCVVWLSIGALSVDEGSPK